MDNLQNLAAILASEGTQLDLGINGVHRLSAIDGIALTRPLYLRMTDPQLETHLAWLAEEDLSVLWPDVDQPTAALRLFLVHLDEQLQADDRPSDYLMLHEHGLHFDETADPYKYTWRAV